MLKPWLHGHDGRAEKPFSAALTQWKRRDSLGMHRSPCASGIGYTLPCRCSSSLRCASVAGMQPQLKFFQKFLARAVSLHRSFYRVAQDVVFNRQKPIRFNRFRDRTFRRKIVGRWKKNNSKQYNISVQRTLNILYKREKQIWLTPWDVSRLLDIDKCERGGICSRLLHLLCKYDL